MQSPQSSTEGLKAVPWPVWAIFVLCLIPELFFTGSDLGLWATPRTRMVGFDYLGFWAGLLSDWQPNFALQPWLMFFTYGFLHGGAVHFLVNMSTLFSLGTPVARSVGSRDFLLLYAILLVAGGLGFALFPETSAPMVGASGALFGLAGIVLSWDFQRRRRLRQTLLPTLQSLAMLAGLNLVLWWAMNGQLAWQTHLGGFVAGWIAAYIVQPYHRRS